VSFERTVIVDRFRKMRIGLKVLALLGA